MDAVPLVPTGLLNCMFGPWVYSVVLHLIESQEEEAFRIILTLQLLNLSHRPNAFHPQQGSAFNQSSMALITILIPRHDMGPFTYSVIENGSLRLVHEHCESH